MTTRRTVKKHNKIVVGLLVLSFYSLFSRVVQLVFAGAAETLLSPSVGPQALHGGEKFCRVRLGVLHTTDHITNQLCISLDKERNRILSVYLELIISCSRIGTFYITNHYTRRFLMKKQIKIKILTFKTRFQLTFLSLSPNSMPSESMARRMAAKLWMVLL